MNVRHCLTWAVDPALDWLAEHGLRPSEGARLFLLAVAGQESGFKWRAQVPSGPARGLWQFEPLTVGLILKHPVTGPLASALCRDALVSTKPSAVFDAIEHHDQLAAAFARLLLLADPHPLPETALEGWDCYVRVWRPGRPRSESWASNWANACGAVAMRRWQSLVDATVEAGA